MCLQLNTSPDLINRRSQSNREEKCWLVLVSINRTLVVWSLLYILGVMVLSVLICHMSNKQQSRPDFSYPEFHPLSLLFLG